MRAQAANGKSAGDKMQAIAAAVQDSVVKAGNLKYEQKHRRFSLELNRYRWDTAPTRKGQPGERVRAELSAAEVDAVRARRNWACRCATH